jgi:riboflavin kinase
MKSKNRRKEIEIVGKVKTGLGEGRYYMRQPGYRMQFIKELGINPYHGTLNLGLSEKNVRALMAIKRKRGIMIRGFRKGKKTFGDVLCYRAEIEGIECGLVMPKLSKHFAVAEIISAGMLRRMLRLKNGERVKVLVKV